MTVLDPPDESESMAPSVYRKFRIRMNIAILNERDDLDEALDLMARDLAEKIDCTKLKDKAVKAFALTLSKEGRTLLASLRAMRARKRHAWLSRYFDTLIDKRDREELISEVASLAAEIEMVLAFGGKPYEETPGGPGFLI